MRRVGGRGREEGGKGWKRIQEHTCWLQWCSHQMHDFQVWRLARESWEFSHSLALACLTTLSCPTKLSAQSDIRPDAGHLRMFFIAAAPTATVLRQVHHRPLQQRRNTPVALDSWLSTAFSKSTVLFDSPSRKSSWDWRVTQTAVLDSCSPKFSSPFLLFTWRQWRNDRVKYLH